MTTPVFQVDQDAWDKFAAAALTAAIHDSDSAEQAAIVAATVADELLKLRKERQDAADKHLKGGRTPLKL